MYDKKNGQFFGEASLGFFGHLEDVEPDLKLLPRAWGRGISTEVIGLITDFLFAFTQTDSILFTPNVHNQAAIRVYEKCGFNPVGQQQTWNPPAGLSHAVAVTALPMRLTKLEYQRRQRPISS